MNLCTQRLCDYSPLMLGIYEKKKGEKGSRFLRFARNFNFIVIDTTRRGYWMIRADQAGVVAGTAI